MSKDFVDYFIVALYGVWQKQGRKSFNELENVAIATTYKLGVLGFKKAD